MHVGFPIRWPSNLTILLIERNAARVWCTPSLAHPCAQRVAVAERGCLFPPPGEVDRLIERQCANHPAQWPYDLSDTHASAESPPTRWAPHRIPPPPSAPPVTQKFDPRLADPNSRFVDVYA